MRIALLILFSLLSSAVFAQVHAPVSGADLVAKLPFSVLEQLSIQGEVQTIRKLAERVKAGDRSLCRGYLDRDMSGCAESFIRNYRVHSAQALREMLDLTVAAGLKDREQGFNDRASLLRFAQVFLMTAEKVRPQKFFAVTIHARTKADRFSQRESKRWQNECLRNFRQYALTTIETYLAQVESHPPSVDSHQRLREVAKALELRSQLGKLRVRRWTIS